LIESHTFRRVGSDGGGRRGWSTFAVTPTRGGVANIQGPQQCVPKIFGKEAVNVECD